MLIRLAICFVINSRKPIKISKTKLFACCHKFDPSHTVLLISVLVRLGLLGLIFFNTWFTDFFYKILRSEEGKK